MTIHAFVALVLTFTIPAATRQVESIPVPGTTAFPESITATSDGALFVGRLGDGGRTEQAATLAAGRAAFANLHVEHRGTTFVVPLLGNSQRRYSVLRFTREPLVVPRGSTVTWTMRDTFEVHTVTFTSGEKPPEFVVPEPQSSGGGPPKLLLNPRALTPTTTTQYDGTGYVNSGMIFPPGNAAQLPSSYSLTFTTPGRFEYWCLIHADVGQRGTIVVR